MVGQGGGRKGITGGKRSAKRWLLIRGLLIEGRNIGEGGANSPLHRVLTASVGTTAALGRVASFLSVESKAFSIARVGTVMSRLQGEDAALRLHAATEVRQLLQITSRAQDPQMDAKLQSEMMQKLAELPEMLQMKMLAEVPETLGRIATFGGVGMSTLVSCLQSEYAALQLHAVLAGFLPHAKARQAVIRCCRARRQQAARQAPPHRDTPSPRL